MRNTCVSGHFWMLWRPNLILIYVTIDNNRVSTDTLAEKALELELLGPLFVLETVCFCVAARTLARLACFSGRVRKVIFLSNPGATRGGRGNCNYERCWCQRTVSDNASKNWGSYSASLFIQYYYYAKFLLCSLEQH